MQSRNVITSENEESYSEMLVFNCWTIFYRKKITKFFRVDDSYVRKKSRRKQR